MASTIETGHAKNVANFHQVISFCAGYGKNYNPSRKELTLTNLQNVYSQAQAVLNDVKNTKAAFDNATNARREAFASLPKFSTQVVNALAVSGVSPLAVNDAKGILRKMKGRRAGETKVAAAPATTPTKVAEDKKISVSQLSYDSLIDHFAKLVATVSQQPAYIPNEKELSTGTLQTKLNDLSTVNSAVIDSYTT